MFTSYWKIIVTPMVILLLSGIYNPYEFKPPHCGGSEITNKVAP
jgi:hypothetical protein